MNRIADTSWYNGVSEARSLPLRCPFATVDRCPRYYQSLSLLSKTGVATIEPEEDLRLLEKWKGTEFWPKISEHETSVNHSGERLSQINNFCPEVTHDRYGLFCTDLGTYSDEIDMGIAHNRLSAEGASKNNPNWNWSYAKEGHFSECPLYPVLSYNDSKIQNDQNHEKVPWWHEHLLKLIVGIFIVLAAALFKYWLA